VGVRKTKLIERPQAVPVEQVEEELVAPAA
jgi:hypothetical protein